MAALDSPDMCSRAVRIESFKKSHKKQKKRASTQSKKTLTAKWPHETPTAEQLARAGFYFHFANDEDVDSTRCFSCGLKLDGWEPDDDPLKEHIAHIKGSERCVWATSLSVSRAEGDEPEGRDPLCDVLFNARKDTFGDRWPHETKRSWKCKTDRMAEAGWSFDPSPEDSDGVACHYCGLELSGFEPKDDPFEEHKRRNESCRFFKLIDFYHQGKLPKRKKTKTTKSRSSAASKASRASMRSVVSTAVSEGADLDDGGTDILAIDDTETAAPLPQMDEAKPKRATKAKAATKPSKGRKKAASQAVDEDVEDEEIVVAGKAKKASKKVSQAKKCALKEDSVIEQRASAASSQLQSELEESILQDSPNYWINPDRESTESYRGVKRRSDGSVKSGELDASELDFPLPPTQIGQPEGPKSKRARTATSSVVRTSASTAAQPKQTHISEHDIDEQAIAEELARIEAEERSKAAKRQPKQKKASIQKKSTSQAIKVLEDEIDQVRDTHVEQQHVQPHSMQTHFTPSPSGSDKENNPSSLDSENFKPSQEAIYTSPTKTSRIPLAQSTPNRPSPHKMLRTTSPSKRELGTMISTVPWSSVDVETVFLSPSQHTPSSLRNDLAEAAGVLSQTEREMTVESWIKWRAALSEDEMKRKCEDMVGTFEREGNRALECLHGLSVTASS